MKLRDLGEGGLIRYIRDHFPGDIGDDAAIVDIPAGQSIVFCSDLVVEDTHFLRNLHPPDSIAYKAIAANVSDVASMGGVATHFLMSIATPPDLEWSWFERFFEGVTTACAAFKVSLTGGDSSSSGRIFLDVAMIGRVPIGRAVRRSGAKIGDTVYVTGSLGSSALGLEQLQSGRDDDPAVKRHLYPEPRCQVGPSLAGRAHAMTDVSDGLSTDLSHILQESEVSARIYKDRLPRWPNAEDRHVLHGGEEYELIVVAPPGLPSTHEGIPLTAIGEIIESAAENQAFLIEGTQQSVLGPRGWQHFE
jgi:thiamine-monophosphate kinase